MGLVTKTIQQKISPKNVIGGKIMLGKTLGSGKVITQTTHYKMISPQKSIVGKPVEFFKKIVIGGKTMARGGLVTKTIQQKLTRKNLGSGKVVIQIAPPKKISLQKSIVGNRVELFKKIVLGGQSLVRGGRVTKTIQQKMSHKNVIGGKIMLGKTLGSGKVITQTTHYKMISPQKSIVGKPVEFFKKIVLGGKTMARGGLVTKTIQQKLTSQNLGSGKVVVQIS